MLASDLDSIMNTCQISMTIQYIISDSKLTDDRDPLTTELRDEKF